MTATFGRLELFMTVVCCHSSQFEAYGLCDHIENLAKIKSQMCTLKSMHWCPRYNAV